MNSLFSYLQEYRVRKMTDKYSDKLKRLEDKKADHLGDANYHEMSGFGHGLRTKYHYRKADKYQNKIDRIHAKINGLKGE